MKLVTFPIGNDIIEVYNSLWTGVETVKFNGHVVSKHFNWFVGIHPFKVVNPDTNETDEYRVEIRFNLSSMTSVSVDIYLNGVCVYDQSGRNALNTLDLNGPRPGLTRDARNSGVFHKQKTRVANGLYREEDLV